MAQRGAAEAFKKSRLAPDEVLPHETESGCLAKKVVGTLSMNNDRSLVWPDAGLISFHACPLELFEASAERVGSATRAGAAFRRTAGQRDACSCRSRTIGILSDVRPGLFSVDRSVDASLRGHSTHCRAAHRECMCCPFGRVSPMRSSD